MLAGRPEYTIDMTGNYLMAGSATQILTTVNDAINGFTYRPFSATIINAPYLWPMDAITFTDKDGNNHTCVLTNVNFGINGAMSIEGKGESMQAASRDALSGMTKEQGVIVEQAREATQKLDDSLTQEEIFNRLTGGGEEQGLILYNGKLYINASYINTGEMSADRIRGGTLAIGGLNNRRGSIVVYDGSGNVVGRWLSTGLYVNDWGVTVGEEPTEVGRYTPQAYIDYDTISLRMFHKDSESSYSGIGVLSLYTDNDGDDGVRHNFLNSRFDSDSGEIGEILYIRSNDIRILPQYGGASLTNVLIEGNLRVQGDISIGSFTGASGTFTTADGKTVTVTSGIITNIA